MKSKRILSMILIATTLVTTFVGCSSKDEAAQSGEIGGVIKVVTGLTDQEELLNSIEEKFKDKYPNVEDVVFESSTDYDKYIQTRMNSTDYGDVLFIPFSMSGNPSELQNYFEPLGTVDELSKEYIDVTEFDFDNTVYGLPASINTLGLVYNEDVLKKAGITKMPTSTEELIQVCEQIKEKTDAIPLFTNYQRVAVWGGSLTSYGGEQYRSDMLSKGTAFKEGQPIREVMDLFYEVTSKGLTEQDPVTGDQGKAYQMLADGEVAMIMRGSQDVPTIQALNSNSTIKIMPFPVMLNGKTSVAFGSPGVVGVNKNSENKATARAFLDFFISPESGYADASNGMVPSLEVFNKDHKDLVENNNIILTVPTETPETDEKYEKIANEVGVARLTDVIQKTINIALYPQNNESYDEYVNSLEASWETAVKNNE